ncbi:MULTISPECIES: DUF1254 domain-containing protein [unclassified Pseudomonas]|uniref:DUF1254 domain-containing protein n=1 Tax=unclassified Pseudomonas TaxID=196821 RepID=UPI00244C9D84|nr:MULTISPECIES: DUF1254 domain-containing protein [unclassified Pseudomonas]MDH0893250.1 DUF1254 domain-containing protein [Pseudomonas sp. GD03875]MDH1064244.1 DUF1254 domain-containing protein [Pseudomonas sp. GD03985]
MILDKSRKGLRLAITAAGLTLACQAGAGQLERLQTLAQQPFAQGYPTAQASRDLAQELFFQRAVQVYHWALPAVNMYAMKEGTARHFGSGYNVMALWKQRLDAKTLILTPNSDVIYGLGFLDLGQDGPLVVEAPPGLQALIDDFWHRPIQGPTLDGRTHYGDIGLPGPDRGQGGRYLILPPGYQGEVPDGYFVYRSETNGVFLFLRSFFQDPNNLAPAVAGLERIKVYPLGQEGAAKPMQFPDASGVPANLLPPGDASYFEILDRFIQSEVVDPRDHYMRGMAAAIGIVKGQPFKPSEEQRKLLDLAAQSAWKMAKVIAFEQFEKAPKARWYADRQWLAHVRNGGDDFRESVDDIFFQVKGEHYTDLDAQVHMFINAYSTSAGMMTSIPGVGAKFLEGIKDSRGRFLSGDSTYRLTLPAGVPAKLFWSVTAYDAVSGSGLDNGQPFPSIGSRDDLTANADGSVTLYFGPQAPVDKDANWVRTVPGKGWFSLLRLYGPEQAFFDKTWIPGDFEKLD